VPLERAEPTAWGAAMVAIGAGWGMPGGGPAMYSVRALSAGMLAGGPGW
jgi:hypothetical protein